MLFMKKGILFGFLLLTGVRCSSSLDTLMTPEGCVSDRPILTGKWTMTEFRYFGGCCPPIADSSWKKAPENLYLLEFTVDGKIIVTNALSGTNGAIPAQPAQLATTYTIAGKEVTLGEQILGGVAWAKNVWVVKLTTSELILAIAVGKEGETNERKFIRSCR